MDVSVIIVSYNGKEHLRECLHLLEEHASTAEREVIVVDNASGDGSPQMVAAEFSGVRLIALDRNTGFAAGANRGLAEATGEAAVFLNPDSLLTADPFGPMLAYLREHPDAGIVGPKLLDEDGTLQLSCRGFPTFSTALFNRYSLLTRLFPGNRRSSDYLMSDWDHADAREVDWLSGACMMVRRSLLEELGRLDEGYFMYIEDVDLCRRVHEAGYKVVYLPEVSVVHHIGKSSRTLASRSIIERHRSMWRYYRKWLRRRWLLDVPVAAGLLSRCAGLLAWNKLKQIAGRQRA